MKIPCAKNLPFIVTGLAFLQASLTSIQFYNLTLIATALVLGSKFNLTEISFLWLKEKCVSTLSYLLSDAKFSVPELNQLYSRRVQKMYKLEVGYFIIDDTMKHHTKFCKWIHGVGVLFDHVFKTNLKVTCIVFLYYSDGVLIKFPISYRIYYKKENSLPWQKREKIEFKTKHELALEMLKCALNLGFPDSTVLADSWFCTGNFIKGLRSLRLNYVMEVKHESTIRVKSEIPKRTPKGRLSRKQYDLIFLPDFFKRISFVSRSGFKKDKESQRDEKVLYHTKIATEKFNALPGKHRIIESFDPVSKTVKYILTNQLTYEATRIISEYSNRWVIEEFFRNAKQLTNMEGATIRSEQGITTALSLVSWIDALLHYENYKYCTAGKLTKEPLTIPSIVRRYQYENLKSVLMKAQTDENFIPRWLEVEKSKINRLRKERKELNQLDESIPEEVNKAA